MRAKINYVLAATLLSSGMSVQDIASQLGGNAETIRKTLWRRGVTQRRIAAMPLSDERTNNVVYRVANEAGKRVRASMAGVVEREVDALAARPPSADLETASKVAYVLEPLARTAKIIHGWSEGDGEGVVMIGRMKEADQETNQVIDVEASPQSLPQMDM